MENGQVITLRPWLTAKEAANYLGVSVHSLYSYTKQRKGRPPMLLRMGGKTKGRLRFPREEFIRWANESTKQG
jgi:predicted site-specific integrase-resolvase